MKQHHAGLAGRAVYPIQIDEIAIWRIPALSAIRWQRAFNKQRPDGLPVCATQPARSLKPRWAGGGFQGIHQSGFLQFPVNLPAEKLSAKPSARRAGYLAAQVRHGVPPYANLMRLGYKYWLPQPAQQYFRRPHG